ncbi:MAG: ABC transporter permease [Proteobacteria bacterium ST_bin12]|nr:MAG: ABC transporter permease [Proteobacteria bacterium ST_bin12]
MKTWLTYHAQALRLVLSRFQKNKLSTFLICLSIGVTLALPSIAYIILDNLNGLVSNVKSESKLSVFLIENHDEKLVARIEIALKQNPAIQRVVFVSKEEALTQLATINVNKALLDSLSSNPLPDAFFIEPTLLDTTSIESLKNELSKIDGVETVLVDDAWIKRLNYLLQLGQKVLLLLTSLLGFALIVVIGNTIRMQVLTQQAEIELSKLIGATNNFIRRPFLYSGLLYGFGGGVLAGLISWLVILVLNQTVTEIAASYQTDFKLIFSSNYAALTLLIIACLIGLISAYFSLLPIYKKS